ncbi:MAG: cyclic pyranopterin monophosphate synthase MoaC [Dehalococcoidales bacterium]|nr:cyclic pyranopterin monophosphate synthase MoaC [Dehalococcoidales bacterium]MDP7109709.1 cyclic pyranopterin monophosphate synthase MoaC [Dehalococcoidales bacterium]MDP7309904.1 cyclic pyranopterin monophosphate synthase MoaC [Dehalococcoidales bacterium]MDP7409690.1 cyclic pyranopterin monophosphate synthase MoaC [Dehalococcoidales bacterium]MDP7676215.1 cyclic pyranopterin monophosphate synthase MoaC [Dehalococcoidales bacterium]
MNRLTHVDAKGEARMVDVGAKGDTKREATAKGKVIMKPTTLEQIKMAGLKKGNVLAVAQVAGIMAAKKTPDLIPLCHPILINDVIIEFDLAANDTIGITATVKSSGKTGVEMEALVATSAAALTIYDMAKAIDKGMTISEIYLKSKTGGKSGTYRREEA